MTNNQPQLYCHPQLLPLLLMPGVLLLWIDVFSLPPPLILEIILNMVYYER